MTPVSLTSCDLTDTKPAPLDRAKQLAATLLSERSEASGALVARQLHEVLRALDAGDRHGFQGRGRIASLDAIRVRGTLRESGARGESPSPEAFASLRLRPLPASGER
jgi:hypothetical protein